MKNLYILISSICLIFGANSACFADTFKHHQTNEVLHGYATSRMKEGKTVVHTQDGSYAALNLGNYDVTPDALGRNNKVIIITVESDICLEYAAKELELAISNSADRGPLFILLELDTPGGRIDLAQKISAAITKTNYCRIICFVKGGKYGGAISAGVAIAMACNKLYMVNNSVLGGAMPLVVSEKGPKDMKEAFGNALGEKFTSVWRANLASLAEHNGRSALLARAMVGRDVAVVEISDANSRNLFIDPADKKSGQSLVKTWNHKGSILTLTAEEAVKCGMADKIVNNRQEVLADLNADKAEIITNDSFQQAGQEIKKAQLRLNQLQQSVDLKLKKIKYMKADTPLPTALGYIHDIKENCQGIVSLGKKYPDLDIDVEKTQGLVNEAQAVYDGLAR